MKNPEEFVKTIYLGDRACKTIIIDGWNRHISLQIDTISRIRDSSGNWNFYTEEDIENGFIVFDSVSSFTLNPQGDLPNDWIDIIRVEKASSKNLETPNESKYKFTISLGSVKKSGTAKEIIMEITASSIYLEDPNHPGIKIVD